jgi:hypothetical protein
MDDTVAQRPSHRDIKKWTIATRGCWTSTLWLPGCLLSPLPNQLTKCSGQSVKALSPALFFDSATDKSEIKRQVKRQVNTYGQLAAYKNARSKLVPKPIAQPKTDWWSGSVTSKAKPKRQDAP